MITIIVVISESGKETIGFQNVVIYRIYKSISNFHPNYGKNEK